MIRHRFIMGLEEEPILDRLFKEYLSEFSLKPAKVKEMSFQAYH